jgi:asparagine synthase (glutamine-hydrolysing)
MCGIAGVWGSTPLGGERTRACLESMRHRGPDDHAFQSFESPCGHFTTLIFSRLSIIDLDHRANQPMHSHGVWVTLNGEIYNYREVRTVLEGRGVRFRTTSDTEVLLEGYREFGWAVLDMLEGMWAFAIYDESTERLSLCRDRFGEKPLHLTSTPTGFAYASEVTALSILTGARLNPNHDHIKRFLINGYKALYKTRETFFNGVSEVGAGTIMHIDDDGIVTSELYWTPKLDIAEDMDFEQAVAGARKHLRRSVEIRLRADVPLAFSLSGGVDSVALVSIARRELGADVHGFTILNSDPRYEERALVQQVVSDLGIQHTGIELDTSGFLDRLRSIVTHRGAPVFTITYYVQWLLMQEVARSGYKVVVGGTGADEIFTGYYDHHLLYIAALDPAERADAIKAWEIALKSFVRNPYLQDPDRFVTDPDFRDHIYLEADRFASYVVSAGYELFTEVAYHPLNLRNRMLNELFHETVPVIMHEEDLNAMTFSIENRSPYLDRNLMEFTSSIPSRLLVRNGRAKAVLREAVRGIAPDSVLDNARKVGFNAPIEDLVELDNPEVRAEILADSPIYEIVRRDAISDMLENRELRNSESKFLFSFLGSKLFLEEFE